MTATPVLILPSPHIAEDCGGNPPTYLHEWEIVRVKGKRFRAQCTHCQVMDRWQRIGQGLEAHIPQGMFSMYPPAGEPARGMMLTEDGHARAYQLGSLIKEPGKDWQEMPFKPEERLEFEVERPRQYGVDSVPEGITVDVPYSNPTYLVHPDDAEAIKAAYESRDDLEAKTRDGLRAQCKDMGLTGYGHLNKRGLIDLIISSLQEG